MAQKEIKTSIQINATPDVIWSILTDFERYNDWNPFLKNIQGDVQVGNRIKVEAGGMKFKPKILVFDENKELRWIGKFLFKGLFDGEHRFLIEDNGNGTSTFQHEESFKGVLVGLFAKKLDTDTKEGFEAMNQQLKLLAERL